MGYDLYWACDDDWDRGPYDAARREFQAAVKARNDDPDYQALVGYEAREAHPRQQAVHEAHRRMNKLELNYFRLNIWGMGRAYEELAPVGVIVPMESKRCPRPEDFGLDAYPMVEYDDFAGWTDEDDKPIDPDTLPEAVRAHAMAIYEWRDGPADGDYHHGIPSYKVYGSNDGWLVRPIEIQTGIGWADEHHPGWRDGLTDFVAEFVVWMQLAAEHGGFRTR